MKARAIAAEILVLLEPDERRRILALLFLIVVNGIIETAGIVSIMPFLAAALQPDIATTNPMMRTLYGWLGSHSTQQFLITLGILTIVALAVSNAIASLTAWALFRFSSRQGYRLGKRMLRNYLYQPYDFFLTSNTVDLARHIYDEIPRVIAGVVLPVLNVVSKSISVAFIIALLVAVDPTLALVIMGAFGGAYILVYQLIRPRLTAARDLAGLSRTLVLQQAVEAIGGIKELKILGREEWSIETYGRTAYGLANAEARVQILATVPRNLLEAIGFGTIVGLAVFLLSGDRAPTATLSIIALYALSGYRLLPALQGIYANITYINYYSPSLALVAGQYSRSRVHGHFIKESDTAALTLHRVIEFVGVSFRYETASTAVIENLNLQIPVNSVVGIAGKTGSGKSTILDVLTGLLQPTEGQLRLDDTAVVPENVRAWQRNIGYVPQQVYLSDGTIAANIAFGTADHEIDRERMVAAARAAQLHDFVVDSLSDGYDTEIGERGTRLSGGQRQRIGIARALYRDPPVLVLDEATSALDNVTEAAIMEAIRSLAARKTVIMVAHRLSTLRSCDNIIVMANGRVEQQGTYDQLLMSSPSFRELEQAHLRARETDTERRGQ